MEEDIPNNPSEELYEELDKNRAELEKMYEENVQGLIIQSRVQHYEEGEKSSKFFLNQIKQNKQKSTIRKLTEENEEITDEKKYTDKAQNFLF